MEGGAFNLTCFGSPCFLCKEIKGSFSKPLLDFSHKWFPFRGSPGAEGSEERVKKSLQCVTMGICLAFLMFLLPWESIPPRPKTLRYWLSVLTGNLLKE